MASELTEDIGTITAIAGNMLTIEIPRGGGCKNCAMHGLCGSGNTPVILQLESKEKYQVGDKLIMEVSSGVRIASALIIFMLPLVIMVLTYAIASTFLVELYSILSGLGSMIIAFWLIRMIDKRFAKQINFTIGGRYEDLPE